MGLQKAQQQTPKGIQHGAIYSDIQSALQWNVTPSCPQVQN